MSYQSNPNRTVEESYDSSSAAALLPSSSLGAGNNINVGASNSARGEGTTLAELKAKFRSLNSCACLFILVFHTLPIVLNPVRLTLLVSSPIKLILELIVGLLALFLLVVEARIPVLGEKALVLMKKFAVGGNQCIDLDVAGGRVTALMIMGTSLALINYLALPAHSGVSPIQSDDEPAPSVNGTSSENDDTGASDNVSASILFTIIQCTIFSPNIWIIFTLAAYTIYVMHTFPEYAESREYSLQDGSNTTAPASEGPTWASNVGSFVQGKGYQTVGV